MTRWDPYRGWVFDPGEASTTYSSPAYDPQPDPWRRHRGVARRPAQRYQTFAVGADVVGRSQPDSEIADHDAATQQLAADIATYNPTAAEQFNYGTITHKMNGYELDWGMFKTELADDWWWGDDDEVKFAGLKTRYNQIRKDFLEFTSGQTTAPDVDPSPPDLDEDSGPLSGGPLGQQALDTAKGLVWFVAIAGAVYVGGLIFWPKIVEAMFRGGATPSSSGG